MMEMAGLREADATPQDVASYEDEIKAVNAPQRKTVQPKPPAPPPTKTPVKPPVKSATPQAVDDPSTKIKEGLLMQLRNFKY
jgi:hypothetical protein